MTIREALTLTFGLPGAMPTAELIRNPKIAAKLQGRCDYWRPGTRNRDRSLDGYVLLVKLLPGYRCPDPTALVRAFCSRRPADVPKGDKPRTAIVIDRDAGLLVVTAKGMELATDPDRAARIVAEVLRYV